MITLYTDAATNPKTKDTGIGISYRYDVHHYQLSIPLLHHYTNHEGEFIALIIALDTLISENLNNTNDALFIYSDSKTLIDAILLQQLHNKTLKELLTIINYRLSQFSNVHLQWISEQKNKEADTLARQALHQVSHSSLPHPLNIHHF